MVTLLSDFRRDLECPGASCYIKEKNENKQGAKNPQTKTMYRCTQPSACKKRSNLGRRVENEGLLSNG